MRARNVGTAQNRKETRVIPEQNTKVANKVRRTMAASDVGMKEAKYGRGMARMSRLSSQSRVIHAEYLGCEYESERPVARLRNVYIRLQYYIKWQ